MLSLELFGALARCGTFRGVQRADLRAISRIYLKQDLIHDYREMQARARGLGRKDADAAIERSLKRSARLARWLKLAAYLRTRRVAWRCARPLERMVLARSIT